MKTIATIRNRTFGKKVHGILFGIALVYDVAHAADIVVRSSVIDLISLF